ncbi:hypothetical protein [Natronoglycomyces albus]|uniref:Uncharacterized protein n=1 Tax=Natronoglycomyces albus TaxID=2811108 RepID=A0A895XTH7_9ACTN|nr:hypothetical protein [Natronoglycomyces albus]QSB06793.1 hypothetical protein JQS30_07870 [Natronoglycomyces albus]
MGQPEPPALPITHHIANSTTKNRALAALCATMALSWTITTLLVTTNNPARELASTIDYAINLTLLAANLIAATGLWITANNLTHGETSTPAERNKHFLIAALCIVTASAIMTMTDVAMYNERIAHATEHELESGDITALQNITRWTVFTFCIAASAVIVAIFAMLARHRAASALTKETFIAQRQERSNDHTGW